MRRAQSVRIGAIPALALSLLPPAILDWKRDYPDMACELSSDHSRELVQKLLMREIDLALTLNFSGHPGLTTQVLANGVLVALASKGYWPETRAASAPAIGRPGGRAVDWPVQRRPAGGKTRQLPGERRPATRVSHLGANLLPGSRDGGVRRRPDRHRPLHRPRRLDGDHLHPHAHTAAADHPVRPDPRRRTAAAHVGQPAADLR